MLAAGLQVVVLVAQAVAHFEAAAAAVVSKGTSFGEVVALQGVLAWVQAGEWKVVPWVQAAAAAA